MINGMMKVFIARQRYAQFVNQQNIDPTLVFFSVRFLFQTGRIVAINAYLCKNDNNKDVL